MASSTGRSSALDLARGLAILGALATNIWIFTDPEGFLGYLGAAHHVLDGGGSTVAALAQQLAQGKFLGLLTLLFGIGLELQRRSAVRRGHRWPGRYPLRAGILFLDGAVNYVLVAEFDVLMGYAVTALVVAYLLATSERAQRVWITVAASVHLVGLSAVALLLTQVPTEEPAPPLDPNPYADGSFLDLAVLRLQNVAVFRAEPVLIFALSVAVFLLGARLTRAGILDVRDERGARLRRRFVVVGAVALVVDLSLGLFGGLSGLVLARYGTAPLVALGVLSLVVEYTARHPEPGRWGRGLVAVGRTALSCYLLQNLLAGAVCYGWGLGLASALDPAWRVPATLALLVGIWLVLMVSATRWLRHFDRGPLELLSHRLTGSSRSSQAAPPGAPVAGSPRR